MVLTATTNSASLRSDMPYVNLGKLADSCVSVFETAGKAAASNSGDQHTLPMKREPAADRQRMPLTGKDLRTWLVPGRIRSSSKQCAAEDSERPSCSHLVATETGSLCPLLTLPKFSSPKNTSSVTQLRIEECRRQRVSLNVPSVPVSSEFRRSETMKGITLSAALVVFSIAGSANAGLFGMFGGGHSHGGCGCAPEPSCCAPSYDPSCCAPAACCEPTCCAPACCAPACCAPAPCCEPTCCAPAPSCCAPATCGGCCDNGCGSGCGASKCRKFRMPKLRCPKFRMPKMKPCRMPKLFGNGCGGCGGGCGGCASAPSCCAPAAPSCCAPACEPSCCAPVCGGCN